MQHFFKHSIALILLTASTSIFAWAGGEPFPDKLIKNSEISEKSSSLYHLLFASKDGKQEFSCSGIGIGHHSILTAGHCLINGQKTEKVLITNSDASYSVIADINAKDMITVKRFTNNSEAQYGMDIGILNLSTISPLKYLELNKNNFYLAGDQQQLTGDLFNPNTYIYGFGFSPTEENEEDIPNFISVQGNQISTILYAPFLGKSYDSYKELHNYAIGSYIRIKDTPYYDFTPGWRYDQTENQYYVDNPSVFLTDKATFHPLNGDSGGAIFICKAKATDCKVIGLVHGDTSNYSMFTTLFNPYFWEVLNESKKAGFSVLAQS